MQPGHRATLALTLLALAAMLLATAPLAQSVQTQEQRNTLPQPLYGYGLASSGDTAYLIGGGDQNGDFTDQILQLDPSGATSAVATLPEPLLEPATASMGSTVYIFGGATPGNGLPRTTDAIHAYDPDTGTIEALSATLPEGISSAAATPLGGYIYIFGGFSIEESGNEATFDWKDTIHRFDPSSQTLTTLDARLPTGHAQMAALDTGDSILLLGGMRQSTDEEPCPRDEASCPTNAILRFNGDATGHINTLPEPTRWGAAVLHEDTAYLLGGCQRDCGPRYAQNHVTTIDPNDGQAETLPIQLPDRNGRHAAHVTSDGTALIPGGWKATTDGSIAHDAIHQLQLGPTPPWAPTDPHLSPQDDGTIHLDWEAPTYDGGAPITEYQILRADGHRALEPIATTPQTPYHDDDTQPGTTYHYQVKAINDAGIGTGTERLTHRPTATPGAPDVTARGGDEVIIAQWSPPEQTGGENITGYRLKAYPGGDNQTTCADAYCRALEPDTRYFQINNLDDEPLQNGHAYTVHVQAQNKNGWGPYSDGITATPNPAPPAPTNLRTDGTGTMEQTAYVNLTWSPSENADTYTVYRGNSLATLAPIGDSTTLRYTDEDAPTGRNIVYTVTAHTDDRESPPSQAIRTVLPEPPSPVRDLDLRLQGDSVLITWRAPADLGGGALAGYDVVKTRGVMDPDDSEQEPVRVPDTVHRDEGIDRDNSVIVYHVRAVTTGGTGPWSMEQVRVPSSDAGTPPRAVLSASPSTPSVGGSVAFDASGSQDAEGIAAYRFSFGDGEGTGWQSSPRAVHTYVTEGAFQAQVEVRDVDGRVSDPALTTIGVMAQDDDGVDEDVDPPSGEEAPLPLWVVGVALAGAALGRRWAS